MNDRGTHLFYRNVTTGTSGDRQLLFNNASNSYNPKWTANDATPFALNTYLPSGAIYNGGYDIYFTVTAGNYYTLIIGENAGSNNNLSILETSYNPKDISSVSQTPSTVNTNQEVTVTINVASSLSTDEYAYLRYSTDGFSTSTITAFNMSGTSGTATIPGYASGTTVSYYVFTSNQSSAPTPSQSDYFSLNIYNASGLNPNGGTNFSYTVNNWSTVSGATNWSSGSSWNGGVAPSADLNMGSVAIGHSIAMDQNNTISAATIGSGATLTVNSGVTLQTNGGITGAGSLTLSGTLQINAGGYTSIAPTYNTNAILKYNSGGTYGRSTEWNSISGTGYPYNVQISNNTILDLSNGSPGSTKECAGDITIDAGSTLTMNPMNAPLRVNGSLTNNGTLTLSNTSGG
ncbi:MAG: hypothetical protein ACK4ON_12955, partial [Bacteroidia bacterium]